MLEPDRNQLETFTDALFRHGGREGFVSLRAFHDGSNKPFRITPTDLAGGFPYLLEVVEDDARRAAQGPKPIVFCPPIAVFSNKDKAREQDILLGLALSVECDQRPREALETLECLLGPATIVVASGGKWTDPETGEVQDRLHLHWRLRVPARGGALAKLKRARDIAARIVGGDPSNKSVCHPIRWPGSWHRKKEPVLCKIETVRPDTEIDLDGALDALVAAAPPPTTNGNGKDHNHDHSQPRDWDDLIKGVISGNDYHNALTSLAAKCLRAGTSKGATHNMLSALMRNSTGPRDARWQTRYDDISRAIDTAVEKGFSTEQQPEPAQRKLPKLQWLDMSNWDREPVPEREWAILDRVPLNQAGLFSGEGGTGKSIIELTKNIAHVAGKDWLGSMPECGPAIYIGAEDDEKELHIRLATIAKHYGVTFEELIAGGLHVLCLLGQDATLCAAGGRSGRVEVTELYRQVYEAAGDIKPKNISIDTLSRAFAGSEIDRVQVYAFAMHMQALAMAAGGSVTVLSHPSLQGISSGSGISGSTAWHGAFRFRQYLTSVKSDDGEQPDNDLRQLEFKKNQYGPKAETVVVRYQHGLFLPVPGIGSLEKAAQEQEDDERFLAALDQAEKQGRHLSDSVNANNYAPASFSKATGTPKARLAGAMERLFTAGKIQMVTYGPPSKAWRKLARKT
jgi:RecA-family ATPase